ncbi:MAG: hypothetical protein N4A45_08420 [Flavobacteriales bacterium]|jgi:hypothetical protein|nr:hypothetical protein [Flavobacteriales bacterium]
MIKKSIILFILSFLALGMSNLLVVSCEKDDIFTGSQVDFSFSTDTLIFDTVFTSVGSVTRRVKIRNHEDEMVKISNIYINKTEISSTQWKVNIDGNPTTNIKDLEIFPNDSIFVFVETTINPNANKDPFISEADLVVEVNESKKKIHLVAWGQNARFYNYNAIDSFYNNKGDTFILRHFRVDTDTTLTADLPHVFYRSIVVRNNATLTIAKGARVHMHTSTNIIVHQGGKLKIEGEGFNEDRVIITSTRTDAEYKNRPGRWGLIRICQDAGKSSIKNAEIKNGTIGCYLGSGYIGEKFNSALTPELSIENSIIRNHTNHGLILQSGKANIDNSEISDCGETLIFAYIGGMYKMNHLTLANYFSGRNASSVVLTNHSTDEDNEIFEEKALDFSMKNSIVYGSYTNELITDKKDGVGWDYVFENNLIRFDNDKIDTSNTAHFVNNIFNEDPKFIERYDDFLSNYRLDSLSEAQNKANINFSNNLPIDLDGNNRLQDGKPDLGAYEREEN